MFRIRGSLSLTLVLPLTASAQYAHDLTTDGQFGRSYVALYELSGFTPSHNEAKSLRTSVETERNHQIQSCEKEEKRVSEQLASARRALKHLNKSSSREDSDTGNAR